MAFTRDRNSHTRGVGAIAAFDGVSPAGRRAQMARARQMARRDRQLALAAMGAISTGYRSSTPSTTRSTITFDVGRPPPPNTPTAPGGGFMTPTATKSGWRVAPTAPKLPVSVDFAVKQPPTTTAPPPPPPVEVVDVPNGTVPPKPASSTSSGGGGGGGGTWSPPSSSGPAVTQPDLPDTIIPSSSSPSISGKHLAIGAAALVAAYYLFTKKA